ncbi:uncharacterized, partial [Tachysurus ichikawai]
MDMWMGLKQITGSTQYPMQEWVSASVNPKSSTHLQKHHICFQSTPGHNPHCLPPLDRPVVHLQLKSYAGKDNSAMDNILS